MARASPIRAPHRAPFTLLMSSTILPPGCSATTLCGIGAHWRPIPPVPARFELTSGRPPRSCHDRGDAAAVAWRPV
eukprot:scaffold1265_cov366-Prasinococcus_capsulatus_cf.AAC.11